nr:ferritin-2, chloroplastic-like [Physcomitrium patens]|eukprot:XP_024392329.1 ferritin-2, chloroplastic-like [Physcomitrella patens]
MEFDHSEKGDTLYSMELTLALERLVNEKLLSLHQVAVDNNDPEMCDFIEREYLYEQVLIYFSTYHHEKLRPVPIYFGLDKAALKYDFRSHDLNQLGFLRSHSQINYCECILR